MRHVVRELFAIAGRLRPAAICSCTLANPNVPRRSRCCSVQRRLATGYGKWVAESAPAPLLGRCHSALARRWRASRMESATIVNVGFAQPLVGKAEDPAT